MGCNFGAEISGIAYRQWATDPNIWEDALKYKIASFGVIESLNTNSGLTQLKQMLANGHILSGAINGYTLPGYTNIYTVVSSANPSAPSDDTVATAGGVHVCTYTNGNSIPNHEITVVGYDDNIKFVDANGNTKYGAFKIANSWGNEWEDSGFIWLSYNTVENNGFWNNSVYYLSVNSQPYIPQAVAKFSMATSLRNKVSIKVNSSNNSLTPSLLSFNGGAYAFNGTTTECTGGFTLDLSGIVNLQSPQEYVTLSINGGTGVDVNTTLDSFIAEDCNNNLYTSSDSNFPIKISSNVISSTIKLTPPIPSASLAEGVYSLSQPISVSLNDTSIGAHIYYTIDGTTPTSTSSLYTKPITISSTTTLQAIAQDSYGKSSAILTVSYTMVQPPAEPNISPGTENYAANQTVSVTLSGVPTGGYIYYTTDGSNPCSSSTRKQYTSTPISISSATTTLQAVAENSYGLYSPVSSATYIIIQPPAEPNISPADGTYGANQLSSVTLGGIPTGGNIYYTTDGSNPKSSSTCTLYSGPITITSTITLNAVAKDSYGQYSSVLTASYTIIQPPAKPNISPGTENYGANQTVLVTLSGVPKGGHIYYTTDGSDPSSSSTSNQYNSTHISISSANTTLQAAAKDIYGQYSTVSSATYTIVQPPAEPNISLAGGTYSLNGSTNKISPITLSGIPTGGHIYYTTDGSDPNSSSNRTLYSKTITLTSTTTLNAIAVDKYGQSSPVLTASYTIIQPPAEPNISSAGGTYGANQLSSVTLSGIPTGGNIYYTTDRSNPKSSSTCTLYSVPITIASTTTLNAVAKDIYGQYSPVLTASYTIIQPPAKPKISSGTENYGANQTVLVTLSGVPKGGYIYYTTDGSDPNSSSSSNQYNGTPISISSATTTLQAVAKDSYEQYSPVSSTTYTIVQPPAEPNISLADGTYSLNGSINKISPITLSGIPTGGHIYYTADGSDPNSSSTRTLYSKTIKLTSTTTLNAIAVDRYGQSSPVLTSSYTIIQPPAEPNISSAGGTYGANQLSSVILSGIPTGGNIYYTTDRSNPKSSSTCTLYSGPIIITSNTTLNAVAEDSYGQYSPVLTASYTIIQPPAKPKISPGTENYGANQTVLVTLSGVPKGGYIYYTTDGSDPTSSSTSNQYTGTPISISSATTTLQAVAKDSYGQYSPVSSATYTIVQPPAEPNISLLGGTFSLNSSINKISPITLSSAPSGGHIYYTTDGSDPHLSSTRTLYSKSITLTSTKTLNAVAVDCYGQYSPILTVTYTIEK